MSGLVFLCVVSVWFFFLLVGKAVVGVRRVILRLVAPTWNFSQHLSLTMKKEEESALGVKSCFSASFTKHKSFEH